METHRLKLLALPIAAGVFLLSAVGAMSSSPAYVALHIAAAVAAALAVSRLARTLGAGPVHALTVAWLSSSALASFILLLGAKNGLAYYLYTALLLVGWFAVATLPEDKASGPIAGAGQWVRQRGVLIATFAALLLAWLPFWLSYFPGIMSPDSLSEWSQALSFHLSDYSPAIYTLFIWLTGTSLRSPGSVSLLQLILSAASIAVLFAYLHRSGAKPWLLAVGLAIYLALPIYGAFTVTLWHDILYSLIVLWTTHAMYSMYISEGRWLADRGHGWALGAALVALPLFAHNGLSVVFGVLAGAFLVLKGHRRRVAAIAGGFVAGFLLVQSALYPLLGVVPYSKAFASEALIHQISAAITQHGTSDLSSAQRRYLLQIMPFKDWVRKYNPYTPQFLVSPRFNPDFSAKPIDQHYGEFLKVWLQIGLLHPDSYLSERLTENALVLRPTGSYRIALSSLDVAPNGMGLKTHSVAQPLLDTLRRIADYTIQYMLWLWRPFWVMWLLLLLTLAGWLLRGRIVLFTAIPWVFQVLGLAISIQGQSVRYYYSLFLILPYFLAVVLMPSQRLHAISRQLDRAVRHRLGHAPRGIEEPG